MPIMSRFSAFGRVDLTQMYTLPRPIYELFQLVPRQGDVFSRGVLYEKLETLAANVKRFEEFDFSVRPTWASYFHNPRSHVIITGHLLFCHVYPGKPWTDQPSTHLYDEEARTRFEEVHLLLQKGRKLCLKG